MILETAQILSTVSVTKCPTANHVICYQPTHENHPCVRWAGETVQNFFWLKDLGGALCQEYTYRYDKRHKCQTLIMAVAGPGLPGIDITTRPQCMPTIYKDEFDCRNAYRNYYLGKKTHLLKYTRRHVPDWVACMGLGEHC